jgi:hypothetical protein
VRPALATDEASFTNELQSIMVWFPSPNDTSLPSILKKMEDRANSNLTDHIKFRLFSSDGTELELKKEEEPGRVVLYMPCRASVYEFIKYITAVTGTEYRIDAKNRQVIFSLKQQVPRIPESTSTKKISIDGERE